MPFADVRGARLFFTDEGDGPPMVFVHGFTCDSHDWSWQLPHFAPSYRVIALDLRGHGRSSAPEDGYEVASLTDDVAALLDHVDCTDAVAVGHSLGGFIVTSLAVERPDLARAVVAVDPGHLLPDDLAPYLATALADYHGEDPARVAARYFDTGSHVPATSPALATWHNRRAAGVPEHVLRNTMTGLAGGDPPRLLRSASGPYLGGCERPVLSLYTDPRRAAQADEVFPHPQSRTVCFEGSGHWLHQERPVEVNTVIDRWLAGLTT
jgi:pimeloyl-ACP methyl ester carboxylesterase